MFFKKKPADPEKAAKEREKLEKLEEEILAKEKRQREKKVKERLGLKLDRYTPPQSMCSMTPRSVDSLVSRHGLTMYRPLIVANRLAELPQDVQISVKHMKTDVEVLEKNMDTLCNILTFSDKAKPRRIFRTSEQQSKIEKLRRERKEKCAMKVSNYKVPRVIVPEAKLFEPASLSDLKKNVKIGDCLGAGGFGIVFEATVKNIEGVPKRVALKIMNHSTEKQQRNNIWEASFLAFLSHPNICKMYKCYHVAAGGASEVWMLMELVDGMNLKQLSKTTRDQGDQLSEREIAYILHHTLEALQYMHDNQLAHRDLKNLNVMLTASGDIKVIDFGLAADFSSGPTVQMTGSPFWMAPEMIRGQPHSYGVDIWSLGICILELANNNPPNLSNERRALFTSAVVGMGSSFGLLEPDRWSSSFKSFLSRMLEQDHSMRATAQELLWHKFLHSVPERQKMRERMEKIIALQKAQLMSMS